MELQLETPGEERARLDKLNGVGAVPLDIDKNPGSAVLAMQRDENVTAEELAAATSRADAKYMVSESSLQEGDQKRIKEIGLKIKEMTDKFNSQEGEFVRLFNEITKLQEDLSKVDENAESEIIDGQTITASYKASSIREKISNLRNTKQALEDNFMSEKAVLEAERLSLSEGIESAKNKKEFADKVTELKSKGISSSLVGLSYDDIANKLNSLKAGDQNAGYSNVDKIALDVDYVDSSSFKDEEKDKLLELIKSAAHSDTMGGSISKYIDSIRNSK